MTTQSASPAIVEPQALLQRFQDTQSELQELRKALFPSRACVLTQRGGYGVVNGGFLSECPVDKVPVRLENGNTWYYPWAEVQRVSVRELGPGHRRTLLRAKGYQVLPRPWWLSHKLQTVVR